MTLNELIIRLDQHSLWVLGYFLLPPLFAGLLNLLDGKRRAHLSPWKYLYAILVYLVALPGVLAVVLIGYALFMRQNLLEVNFLVYFLPIISAFFTLLFIGKHVNFQALPGVGKLTGLLTLILIVCIITVLLYKTRILVAFFGSITELLILGVLLFFALRWSIRKLF